MKKKIFLILTFLAMLSLLSALKADDKLKIAEKSKYALLLKNNVCEFLLTTQDTVFYRGRVLDFNDSLLILWRLNEPITEKNVSKYAICFHVSDIHQITRINKYRKKNGWIKGALFGSALGYQVIFKNMDKYQDNLFLVLLSPSIVVLSALPGAYFGSMIDNLGENKNDWLIKGDIKKFAAIKKILKKNSLLSSLPDHLLDNFTQPLHESRKKRITPELKHYLESLAGAQKQHKLRKNGGIHLSTSSCLPFSNFKKEAINAFVESGFSECNPENDGAQSQLYPITEDRKKVSAFGLEIDLSSHIRLGLSMTKNSSTITGCEKLEESEYLGGRYW